MEAHENKKLEDFLPVGVKELLGPVYADAMKDKPKEIQADFNRVMQKLRSIDMDNIADHAKILNEVKFMEDQLKQKYGAENNR